MTKEEKIKLKEEKKLQEAKEITIAKEKLRYEIEALEKEWYVLKCALSALFYKWFRK